MNLWHLIFIIFCIAYKIESGKIQTNFDEIFGDGWDENEEEGKFMKIEQNEQKENIKVDQMDEMGTDPNDQQKRKIIQKFEAIKEKLKQKRKYQWKNQMKIETKIGKLLGTNRPKIYKWKKEMNLNKTMNKSFYEQKKKKFIERIDEFKILYDQGKQKEFVKELGISERTFLKWKKELIQNYNKKRNTNEDKLLKMKQYFKIKEENPTISEKLIAKKLGIGYSTLREWKKKFASISDL